VQEPGAKDFAEGFDGKEEPGLVGEFGLHPAACGVDAALGNDVVGVRMVVTATSLPRRCRRAARPGRVTRPACTRSRLEIDKADQSPQRWRLSRRLL
jgi:hypothetical protein